MPEQEVRADIDPQLCKTLNPAKHKWTKTWIAEPKFDGLRCIIITEPDYPKAYSRNGKPLWNMTNIIEQVNDLVPAGYVLDGEVYTQDWNLSMGIVKSSTVDHPDKDKLRYHVWDCLTIEEWHAKYKTKVQGKLVTKTGRSLVSNQDRKQRLSLWFKDTEYVQIVQGIRVSTEEELHRAYLAFLAQGYEGAILKDPSGHYECGRRSPNWLKIKPWTDADLTVVGAYAGEGKHLGRIGGLVLEGTAEWNGKEYLVHTEVGTGFTDEEREYFQQLWDGGQLNGKTVEIKFQDITVEGACRFPVYHRLREDK